MVKSANVIGSKALIALSLVLVAALALPVVSCAPKAPEEAAPVVNVRIHSQMPVGHYVTESVDLFIKEAEARSRGSLKFTHYPAMQLYTDIAVAGVLSDGGVEMAQVQGLYFVGKVSEVAGGLLPGFYNDQDHYFRAAYDTDHGGGFVDKILEPAFEKKANVKVLSFLGYSINLCTLTNKSVRKVEDYKGLKIRSLGKSASVLLQALGAAPVVMSASDVYMALQRGTIEGVFSGLTSFYERKWYESAKYVQNYYTGSANFSLAANLDFWNKLTTSQKKAIMEAALIAEIYSIDKALTGDDEARKALIAAGVEVYDFPRSEVQKVNELARPPLIKMVNEDLGTDVGGQIVKMLEDTLDAKTTWQNCCKQHNKRLLDTLK
ncbi:MAG: hypothetical protein FJ006_00010 [Chloroflexi bacterium]|nr:hypothetical protein [Chloroflexota bacterium]